MAAPLSPGLAVALAAAAPAATPLWSVLTDNATGDASALVTGVTYTAEPPFGNPPDTTGRRLVDRGGSYDDWNNTTGINWTDQVVTFDLHGLYRVGRAALLFDMPAKPAAVDIAVAEQPAGPWTEMGRITPEERKGWYELTPPQAVPGRYVRMAFKLQEWGWYLREVLLWGTRGNEPGPEVVLPAERDGDRLLLARDGQPRASIIVAAEPTPKVLRAARDLQEHLLKMSGAVLPLRPDDGAWTGTLVLVGPSRYLADAGVDAPSGYPDNERVIVKTAGDRIVLVGNDDGQFTGTEFAVQMLLEHLGCGWFGPEALWQVVPDAPTVAVAPLEIDHRPPFALRSLWIGLGGRWYLGGPPLRAGHAHGAILPPKAFFQEHPEYYALVGGRRVAEGDWQLCTANPEVVRLTIEKARASFDQEPSQVMFSLSNNDCGGFCECEDCRRTGSNPGARMLTYANAVARGLRATHPDKGVIFLAYWYTAVAPTEAVRAEPGVCVMIVGSGCHAHPETEAQCSSNANWSANLRRWAATGARLGIYEWYIPGCTHKPWRRLPWVAGETAASDQDFWRSLGVTWVTYESQTAYEEQAYPLRWPLFYVAAKRMWDASLSADAILTDACAKLFGSAAAPMRAYYAELEAALRQGQVHSGIWNLPAGDAVYPPAVCERVRQRLAEATAAVQPARVEVQQRVAAEVAAWQLAEQTLGELRAASGRKPVHVVVNGTQYLVEQETITGKLVRELGGIAAEESVFLVADGGERPLKDDEVLKAAEGMRFRSAPR
jgi:hypothetical protein